MQLLNNKELINKVKTIILLLNGSTIFILLIVCIAVMAEKYETERQKKYISFAESNCISIREQAETRRLQAENLKYNYYARLYDDRDFDKWEEE